MSALTRLLNLEFHRLEVFAMMDGNRIGVRYVGAEIKDGSFLKGVCGCGSSVEEACQDYLDRISGKTLVFDTSSGRETVTVL